MVYLCCAYNGPRFIAYHFMMGAVSERKEGKLIHFLKIMES